MSKTLHGLATVDGISGTVTYAAIISPGALEALTAELTDNADVRKRLDRNSEVRGYAVRNKAKAFTVTCLATVDPGSTVLADAKKALIPPPIPSAVTLANFDEASGAGINGSYVYEGGGTISYADDWVRMTLPLVKYAHESAANLVAAYT